MFSKLSTKLSSIGKGKPKKSTAEKFLDLAYKDFNPRDPITISLKREGVNSLSRVDEAAVKRRMENFQSRRTNMEFGKAGALKKDLQPPIDFAPLRRLDDFLLGSARFDLPSSAISWPNRVKENLLYYQSNYAVLGIVVILCAMFLRPAEFVLGSSLVTCAALSRSAMIGTNPLADRIVGSVLIAISFIFPFTFYSMVVFAFSIVATLLLIFIHATLRLRNLGNKIQNALDRATLKKTPMGLLLEYFGQQFSTED